MSLRTGPSREAMLEEAFAKLERAAERLEAKAERSFRQGYIVGALVTTAFGAALTYWWPL